jgi:hypothetical protein
VVRLNPLYEAEANWRCNAHVGGKRVETLAPASTSESFMSKPARYDGSRRVRLIISGCTSPMNRECCQFFLKAARQTCIVY